jgi:hypothetical protein
MERAGYGLIRLFTGPHQTGREPSTIQPLIEREFLSTIKITNKIKIANHPSPEKLPDALQLHPQ